MLARIRSFFDEHISPGAPADRADPDHGLRLAVAALLLEMVQMDGDADAEEQDAVRTAVLQHFGLPAGEAGELLALAEEERANATDYYQFTSLINAAYGREQRIELVELLWRIAYADRSLHRYEEHLVRKVADLLHVSHSDFMAAKHRVHSGGRTG